jgi:hypothetical protein
MNGRAPILAPTFTKEMFLTSTNGFEIDKLQTAIYYWSATLCSQVKSLIYAETPYPDEVLESPRT